MCSGNNIFFRPSKMIKNTGSKSKILRLSLPEFSFGFDVRRGIASFLTYRIQIGSCQMFTWILKLRKEALYFFTIPRKVRQRHRVPNSESIYLYYHSNKIRFEKRILLIHWKYSGILCKWTIFYSSGVHSRTKYLELSHI